jgi:serine transporter
METHTTPFGGASEDGRGNRFDKHDFGWIILSIGMAIGAGIVFLPVQAGLVGIWVFLFSALIAYPALYLFQRLFINTLATSPRCADYPEVISGYLGKNWGVLLGLLYFVMLVIWVFVYSTALTNDSASYLKTYGVTKELLSRNPIYPFLLISVLVLLASRGEEFLFRISTLLVLTKLGIVAFLGISMVKHWDFSHVGPFLEWKELLRGVIITLPFTLTSVLFLQTLSPMVISYRSKETSPEVARRKALRAMNIAFIVLVGVVFFYAISFTLALGHDEAESAFRQNISALAISAQEFEPGLASVLGILLNIFALVTAFFGVYLGFEEALRGIVLNLISRFITPKRISHRGINLGIRLFLILISWGVVVLNVPVLNFTSISSPVFGMVGCLVPAWLVLRVPALARYRNAALVVIIITGFLLIISPFLNFLH